MAKIPNEVAKISLSDIPEIEDKLATMLEKKWDDGLAMHQQRIVGFQFFARVAHNMSLFDKIHDDSFSEGSTQTIKRKIRAQTIQRVPDGEIVTPYDKNTVQQAVIDYLFKHKILQSEFDGKDMLKQLWKTFNLSYDYGFGCVRTGFEEDLDGDPRITYTLINYNDIIPSPDCKCIEEADWYIVREYVPMSTLKSLIDCETDTLLDSTYDGDVVRLLIQQDANDASDPGSIPLADKKKGVFPAHSVEVRTLYERGKDEFITWVPSINRVLRRVENYDPRKDVPIHFLILEPDAEFPYGCSSVMWTIAQQQYADAFQSTAYQTLLLALNPPMMIFGNLTNPKLKMKPRAIWPMGTNPNNRVEPYRVETTTLTQYGSILESISGHMMASLNITDATVASDANVPHYSATPQGVEQQRLDKTITINQYQKRIETFFAEWANHALRSYINCMSGVVEITVDNRTRRKITEIENAEAERKRLELENELQIKLQMGEQPDIEAMLKELDMANESIIDGNKISVDFDALGNDMLFEFEVRTGSLIENEREEERANIQEMLIPISQMMGNVSDDNRAAFEDVLMQLISRLCELSDVDISAGLVSKMNERTVMAALQSTMDAVMAQQQQIGQLQQQQAVMQPPMPQGQPMPPEAQGMPPEAMPPEGMPPEAMPPEMMPPEGLPPEVAGMPPSIAGNPQEALPEEGLPVEGMM